MLDEDALCPFKVFVLALLVLMIRFMGVVVVWPIVVVFF